MLEALYGRVPLSKEISVFQSVAEHRALISGREVKVGGGVVGVAKGRVHRRCGR